MSEDETEKRQAIDAYERYIRIEPHDPRGFGELASAYNHAKNLVKAEAAYRKAIECDPGNTDIHLDFIQFLIVNDRIGEVRPLLIAAEKHKEPDEDLIGSIMFNLRIFEEAKNAEKFAASESLRMKTSYQANLQLGRIYLDDGRYADALRLLNTSARLEKESAEPYVQIAMVYRKQSRWIAALKAAETAINLDDQYSEAYYQRACALARLGRIKEALAALAKSIELDPEQVEYMVEERDLKALSSLPAFKKLIPEPVKQ